MIEVYGISDTGARLLLRSFATEAEVDAYLDRVSGLFAGFEIARPLKVISFADFAWD